MINYISIIGDLMLDHYLTGRVDRISPEAPVPVVNIESDECRLGGAANVALNIKSLGAVPMLYGVCGKDENQTKLLQQLDANGISQKGIIGLSDRPTTVKTRILARYQQLLRLDTESNADLSPEEALIFLENIEKENALNPPSAVILEDYNKGVLTEFVIKSLLEMYKNIPVIVDPKLKNFFAYHDAYIFKPNLKEVCESTGQHFSTTLEDLCKADKLIRSKINNRYTVITLGEKGIFWSDGQFAEIIPARECKIADVCGAGDTVVSVLAAYTAAGLPIRDAVVAANLAGGIVCEKQGVVPIDLNQLTEEFDMLMR